MESIRERMKKIYLIITIIIALTITACGSQATQEAIPTVMLNAEESNTQPETSSGSAVTASAVVVPISDVGLSFPAIGRVTDVNVQVGDEVQAGQVLVELDRTILEAKVREAEANLAFADIQLKYLVRLAGCRNNCATTEEHIEVAENDVARAQALLDSAKAVLESQSNITAPFDGVVVAVNISIAETVTPGQVVVVIGDLSHFQIETTDLSERDINKVKIGQSAIVFIDALGSEFIGKVINIDNLSSTLGGDVVYTVTVELDEQPNGLMWGMSADVEIIGE
jgi:RND family efflux transporter MFP subunit